MTADARLHDSELARDSRGGRRERLKYVVGSEGQQILMAPTTIGCDSGQRLPDGIRHAVDVNTGHPSCGTADSLFVFDDLDWMTMLSNEMCSACKRAAF
jgi:hypothetical protein